MKLDISESARKENPALSLKTYQDVLDFIDKCVKRGSDAFARLELGTPKSYIEGKIVLVLRMFVRAEQLEFDFVFRSLPVWIAGRPDPSSTDEQRVLECHEDGCDEGVFVTVTQVVDCPQGSVSSLVNILGHSLSHGSTLLQPLSEAWENRVENGGVIGPEGINCQIGSWR